MTWEDFALRLAAGAAGGAVLGLKGFFEANTRGTMKFNVRFFAKTLLLPIVLGFASAYTAATPELAFSAGMVGKALQELGSAKGIGVK